MLIRFKDFGFDFVTDFDIRGELLHHGSFNQRFQQPIAMQKREACRSKQALEVRKSQFQRLLSSSILRLRRIASSPKGSVELSYRK